MSSCSQTGCSFASCEEGIDEGVRQNQGDVWGSLPWNLQISAVPSDEKVMDDACQVTRLSQTGNISKNMENVFFFCLPVIKLFSAVG